MKKHAIFGPPGTGKTTRLMEIIAATYSPHLRVAVLSFTKAAAAVLTSRLPSAKSVDFVGTIHSLAFHTLKLERTQVASEDVFLRWCGGVKEEVEYALAIRSYAYKNNTDIAEAYAVFAYGPMGIPFNLVEFYIKTYESWKKINMLFDFDDMIIQATGAIEEQFDLVVVDEGQDLSKIQWDFILSIIASDGQLIIGGDDDQSIFTWAGAYPRGMVEIADTRDILNQSWRIPPEVQKIAQKTIEQVIDRVPKEYRPRDGHGTIRYQNDYNPLGYNTEHTVLCRTQYGIKKVEVELIELGVPYIGGKELFTTPRAKLIRAIETEDLRTIKRLKNYLTSTGKAFLDIGKPPTLNDVSWVGCTQEEYEYLHKVDIFDFPNVTLSTIHGFKGEEAENITLICDCSYIIESAADTQMKFEDEVRVWYVGLTRAKTNLTLVGYNQFILP